MYVQSAAEAFQEIDEKKSRLSKGTAGGFLLNPPQIVLKASLAQSWCHCCDLYQRRSGN